MDWRTSGGWRMERGRVKEVRTKTQTWEKTKDIESMVLCGEDDQDTRDRNRLNSTATRETDRRVMCGETRVKRSPVPPQRRWSPPWTRWCCDASTHARWCCHGDPGAPGTSASRRAPPPTPALLHRPPTALPNNGQSMVTIKSRQTKNGMIWNCYLYKTPRKIDSYIFLLLLAIKLQRVTWSMKLYIHPETSNQLARS